MADLMIPVATARAMMDTVDWHAAPDWLRKAYERGDIRPDAAALRLQLGDQDVQTTTGSIRRDDQSGAIEFV